MKEKDLGKDKCFSWVLDRHRASVNRFNGFLARTAVLPEKCEMRALFWDERPLV